jgi:hypothetical protein
MVATSDTHRRPTRRTTVEMPFAQPLQGPQHCGSVGGGPLALCQGDYKAPWSMLGHGDRKTQTQPRECAEQGRGTQERCSGSSPAKQHGKGHTGRAWHHSPTAPQWLARTACLGL